MLSSLMSSRATYLAGEPCFWLMGRRGKSRPSDLAQVKRVLVVRLDEIGDVLMTTPFLRELRQNLPNAWITLVVKPNVRNLVERCPYVNEVITYDWNVSRPPGALWRHYKALRLAWQHLWKRRFDLAILPRWDADYYDATFLLYFSGAPWRVGYSERVSREKHQRTRGYDRLLTHLLDDRSLKHEVERNLEVIRHLGGTVQEDRLELWTAEEDEAFAQTLLSQHGVRDHELVIAFAPGAGAPKRLWPVERFAEIGSWLRDEYGSRFVLIGGADEEHLGDALERSLGPCAVNAVGRTTLRRAAALIRRCRLFVGTDSGPMHLAAAVGVPVVELSCHPRSGASWSRNSPLRFRPWGVEHTVLQPTAPVPPCMDECVAGTAHCILGITVEEARTAVAERLRQSCMLGRTGPIRSGSPPPRLSAGSTPQSDAGRRAGHRQ